MQISTFAFGVAFAATACAQPSTAITAPTVSQSPPADSSIGGSASPPASSAPGAAPPAASAASTDASAAAAQRPHDKGDIDTSTAGPGASDAGASTQFRTCAFDSDCVAVERVGCCHNGWKEAVAVSQKDAYAKSPACTQSHPMCPMYVVQDGRLPLCENATHLCTMTRPEDVACGGFIRNRHTCPSGYHCELSKHPDVAGKCVQP